MLQLFTVKLPALIGLPGGAEVWSLTGWSRGGDGPSSSFAEPESDFLFRETFTCFPLKQKKQKEKMKLGTDFRFFKL